MVQGFGGLFGPFVWLCHFCCCSQNPNNIVGISQPSCPRFSVTGCAQASYFWFYLLALSVAAGFTFQNSPSMSLFTKLMSGQCTVTAASEQPRGRFTTGRAREQCGASVAGFRPYVGTFDCRCITRSWGHQSTCSAVAVQWC